MAKTQPPFTLSMLSAASSTGWSASAARWLAATPPCLPPSTISSALVPSW
jgi:hypothetical protein